ncbi:Elongation factor P-like protein [Hydrogenovibrio crunogenus]|uniref:Elongation factor P-like protein n=1 Tax=Hydrogenovibrio crunogenus TaxID=39765 RepID=A0A4P7NYR2_9GAMM|nr:elongation factor P-like protein YeiP [Hydrogenovibrio crunogenus]QBZ82816.1 Elongation factor P-like protein [Hydrogenovibrio crunogenus]RUM90297.1 MAG: elongation factor P-like protein YeiP [Thiomicrospira sp.]
MPKANELKKGMVVEINDAPYVVKTVDCKSPSSRGAATLYKVRFNNVKTGQKLDESLKGDDFLKELDCQRMPVQFSYMDGDNYVFMNLTDYSQYTLSPEDLEGQIGYISESLEGMDAIVLDEQVISIELPIAIALEITETAPGMKSASATSRTKPAILSTGLEIQVPEYIEQGEVVKVNSETGKFMSRACVRE